MLHIKFARMTHSGVSLIELLLALVLLGMIAMAFGSIERFSRTQVMLSERRSQIQNDVSLVLLDLQKTMMIARAKEGVGLCEAPALGDGLKIFTSEDGSSYIYYKLSTNTLQVGENCSGTTCASWTTLSTKIVGGIDVSPNRTIVDDSSLGLNLTVNPDNASPANNALVEVIVRARSDPAKSVGPLNPEVSMRAKLFAQTASSF